MYDDPELAAQAEKEEEERLDSILNTDLTQSTDVLGDLSNVITAVNMVADVSYSFFLCLAFLLYM